MVLYRENTRVCCFAQSTPHQIRGGESLSRHIWNHRIVVPLNTCSIKLEHYSSIKKSLRFSWGYTALWGPGSRWSTQLSWCTQLPRCTQLSRCTMHGGAERGMSWHAGISRSEGFARKTRTCVPSWTDNTGRTRNRLSCDTRGAGKYNQNYNNTLFYSKILAEAMPWLAGEGQFWSIFYQCAVLNRITSYRGDNNNPITVLCHVMQGILTHSVLNC